MQSPSRGGAIQGPMPRSLSEHWLLCQQAQNGHSSENAIHEAWDDAVDTAYDMLLVNYRPRQIAKELVQQYGPVDTEKAIQEAIKLLQNDEMFIQAHSGLLIRARRDRAIQQGLRCGMIGPVSGLIRDQNAEHQLNSVVEEDLQTLRVQVLPPGHQPADQQN
jgi:hypothetical protein